ncbi:MAG TPA: hypothetical protein VJ998_03085, partial [Pseudomonadales bacterium]|nr:hypothetical protein [Pseudomonadales bacterium]
FMLSSYDNLVTTNRTVANRMLCRGNKPRYNDTQAYQALDVLDDIKDTNLRKHYRRALVNFGPDVAQALGKWLNQIKQDSAHHTLDHREAFMHSDETVEQAIGTACNVIASY